MANVEFFNSKGMDDVFILGGLMIARISLFGKASVS